MALSKREAKTRYEKLINYRKINKPKRGKECEKHHIIPRCMGGSDELNNLVELTVEEHMICHMYLHYMYPKNGKLAAAVNLMFGTRGIGMTSLAGIASAKRRHRKFMSEYLKKKFIGSGNPAYDHKKYVFLNKDGRKAYCTKHELYTKIDPSVNPQSLGNVFNPKSRNKSTKGWYLEGTDIEPNVGLNNVRTDKKIYIWESKEGEIVECTRYHLYTYIDSSIHPDSVTKVVRGKNKTCRGWKCKGCLL